MGQWLVSGWLWSWGTLDMQLARRKLGKKNTPQSRWPPLPDDRHGALPPAPLHKAISQHAAQVYVIKTREYYYFYYIFISYFKAQCIVNAPCLSVCRLRGAERIILSAGGAENNTLSRCGAESMMLSACAESMIVSVPPAASIYAEVPA